MFSPNVIYPLPSIYHSYPNRWTTIPVKTFEKKVKKPNKTGQGQENFIPAFLHFLTAIAKMSFLEGRLGTRLCLKSN